MSEVHAAAILAYVALLLAISLRKRRSVKGQEDFMVAGRKTSALVLSGTLVCTWIGSGSLFGSAGLAFREGLSGLWFSAGAWTGIALVHFLAPRVRRIAQYTVPDILELRYNSSARILGSITMVIASLTIAGYQFRGAGRLLNVVTGIDPTLGAGLTCALVIALTMFAGLSSVVSMDLLNGIVMVGAILVALPLAWIQVGGSSAVASLPASHFEILGKNGPVWALGVFFPTFFLLLGEGTVYQKFFAARDEAAARRAAVGMLLGIVFLETALVALAVVGSAGYLNAPPFVLPDGTPDKAATETIILHLARFDLPTFSGVLLLCAAVAIIISTANSYLVISSTNLTRDVYQRFLRPGASQQALVEFQRASIVVFGVTAFLVAGFFGSILEMALTAYTMVGAGITPALLAALLWRRVTVPAGVASILSGMVVTLGVTAINGTRAEPVLASEYIILPAAALSLLSLFAVSLLTRPSPPEKWRPFFDPERNR